MRCSSLWNHAWKEPMMAPSMCIPFIASPTHPSIYSTGVEVVEQVSLLIKHSYQG